MAEAKAKVIFDLSPVEPAHSMVVKLHDDLVAIYRRIQDKCQVSIDQAFDSVSRQIGFVITTTVPVIFEVGDNSVVKSISMGAEHLKGTLFDQELSEALNPLVGATNTDANPAISPGTYNLYLLWYDALKLKLRADWMEPAHFILRADLRERISKTEEILQGHAEMQMNEDAIIKPPRPGDPPHWFDPGTLIAAEEKVLISAIDEVYPELRLVDRIASYRSRFARATQEMDKLGPQPEPPD